MEAQKATIIKEMAEMNADSEDENIDLDDEQMEELFEQVVRRDFMTEEEAEDFLEQKFEELKLIRVRPNKQKRKDWTKQPDHFEHLLDEPRPVETMLKDEWVIDQESHNRYFKNVDSRVARYPEGFRQFENYANYQLRYPGSSIQEYTEHMNSHIEFADFLRLMRQAAIEEIRTDDFMDENPEESDDEAT